jgi:hypothetical protein
MFIKSCLVRIFHACGVLLKMGFISEFPVKTEVFVNRFGELQYFLAKVQRLLHDLILYYLQIFSSPKCDPSVLEVNLASLPSLLGIYTQLN